MRKLLTLLLLTLPLAAQTKDAAPRALTSVTFANLGTPANGTIVYCSDCQQTSPTVGSGSGAVAQRENGVWNSGGGGGGGTGCIPAGSSGNVLLDNGAGACTSNAATTVSSGTVTLGTAGSVVGAVKLNNATSGSITVQPPTGALGTVTITVPAATDTLVGKATTDTLTNKTLTSPTLTGPILGTPASGVMTNVTGLPPGAVTSAQGNGTKFQLSTGTTTTNNCVKFDANGNTVDAGSACGGGSSVATPRHIQTVSVRGNPVTSLAYRYSVTSGSVLIVGIGWEGGANTNPTIGDTLTTTWTLQTVITGNANENAAIFTGTASSGGANTVTVTLPAAAGFDGIHISEFDGTTASSVIDVAGNVRDSTLSLTTTQAGDLIYWFAQGAASAGVFTVPPGFPFGLTSTGSDSGQSTFLFQSSSFGLTDMTGTTTNAHWAYAAIALKHP